MNLYHFAVAFVLLLCVLIAVGALVEWREDRRAARNRHPSARRPDALDEACALGNGGEG